MKRLAISCVAVWLVFASPASAAQFSGPQAGWASAQKLHVPGPATKIEVRYGGCPGLPTAGGCATINPNILYVRYSRDAGVLVHELGHFFDVFNLSDAERDILKRALGFPESVPWKNRQQFTSGDTYCEHSVCVNEVFADAYMACGLGMRAAKGSRRSEWATEYGYSPERQQYLRVCRMIRAFA